jgi:hypothetical protein
VVHLLKNCFDPPPDLRESLLDHGPYDVEIDPGVIVDQHISQGGHAAPSDFWVAVSEIAGELLRCLANDFQLPNDGVLPKRFGEEALPPDICVSVDRDYSVENVSKVNGLVTHRGVAVRRISSRMYGLIAASVTI